MSNRPDLPAIAGGSPHRARKIEPYFRADERTHADVEGLLSGSTLSEFYGGRHTTAFEEAFAAYHGVPTAVAVNSGTSAVHAALCAAGVGPGDEVLVPTLCYFSAVTAVTQEHAVPVLYDSRPGSVVADTEQILAKLTDRTAAVLIVHLYGVPLDLTELRAALSGRNVALIEDCGQSHGARAGGVPTGAQGDYGCFSFASPRHHISTGEGGMVIARSPAAEPVLRQIVNKGKNNDWHGPVRQGFSYVLPEFAAVVGLQGLRDLDAELSRRASAAAAYDEVLESSGLILLSGGEDSAHYRKLIRMPAHAVPLRDWFVAAVEAENVSAKPPHPLLHRIPWLAARIEELEGKFGVAPGREPFSAGAFPAAEDLSAALVDLETGPNIGRAEALESAAAVRKVWRWIEDNPGDAAMAAKGYGSYRTAATAVAVGAA